MAWRVDELGGYDTALKLAKKAAGGAGERRCEDKVVYPAAEGGLIESVIARRGADDNSDKEGVGQTLARIMRIVQPLAQQLNAVGINSKLVVEVVVLRMRDPELVK